MKCPFEITSFRGEVFGISLDFFHLFGDLPVLTIAVNEAIFWHPLSKLFPELFSVSSRVSQLVWDAVCELVSFVDSAFQLLLVLLSNPVFFLTKILHLLLYSHSAALVLFGVRDFFRASCTSFVAF
jgi:hypothetical protein